MFYCEETNYPLVLHMSTYGPTFLLNINLIASSIFPQHRPKAIFSHVGTLLSSPFSLAGARYSLIFPR